MLARTLVLGIGNTLFSDEGVGVHAVDHMSKTYPSEDIQYLDGGTLSFDLAEYVENADHLIVIDAGNIQGIPGQYGCFIDQEMDRFLKISGRSVHEIGLNDVLDICRLRERLPERRALYVIQPGSMEWGDQLSPSVAKAVQEITIKVWRLIQTWRQETNPLSPSR